MALEAVLHVDQLADVRRMLELRLGGVAEVGLWRVVTATNELVTNALQHGGRCLGLRVYVSGALVRIEVDDPSPVRVSAGRPHGGLGIVRGLADSWGDAVPGLGAETDGLGRTAGGAAKTVWCEILV